MQLALPNSWASATLGEICQKPQYGWTTPANSKGSGLRLVRTTDISSGQVDWNSVPFCTTLPDDPDKYVLSKGDILISRAGSVGVNLEMDDSPPAIFASYLIRIRPLQPIPSKFVSLFLKSQSYWSQISENVAGISIPNINATKLQKIVVPIPPLAEQKRIVAKVEDLFQELRVATQALQKVPSIMKQFRQSLLAKVLRGEVTEHDPNDEPAEKLLKRLGKRPLVERSNEGLYPLPDGWVWTNMEALIADARYGTSQKCTMEKKGVPVLRIPNISKGILSLQDLKYSEFTAKELGRLRIERGDLLVCRTNGSLDLVGKSAVAEALGNDFVFASYLIRLRPVHVEGLSAYLNVILSSRIGRNKIEEKARSTAGQYNVNLQTLRSIQVPLPPTEEIVRVVTSINEQFHYLEQIESDVVSSIDSAENLEQSILAKAFRGELVPQDPKDEPASELLQRMNSMRAKATVPSGVRRCH